MGSAGSCLCAAGFSDSRRSAGRPNFHVLCTDALSETVSKRSVHRTRNALRQTDDNQANSAGTLASGRCGGAAGMPEEGR